MLEYNSTAESLGVQSGFRGCFDKGYLKSFLNLNGVPVMVGFGYAENTILNSEKHPEKLKPSISEIIV